MERTGNVLGFDLPDIRNWRYWTEGIAEFVPQLGLQAGVALASGGTSLPAQLGLFALTGGSLEAGSAYQEARERDASVTTATAEALLVGTISSVLEVLPGSVILRKNPAAKAVFDRSLKQAVTSRVNRFAAGSVVEGGTEAAQDAWRDTVRWMAENDPEAYREGVTRYARSFTLGGAAGGIMAGARSPDTKAAARAKENLAVLDKPPGAHKWAAIVLGNRNRYREAPDAATRKKQWEDTRNRKKQAEQEAQGAQAVRSPEKEVREAEGGADLRRVGPVEDVTEPAGEGAQAPEVLVTPPPSPVVTPTEEAQAPTPETTREPEPASAKEPPRAGQYIQWTTGGKDRFASPKKVDRVSEDGTHVFVEGSDTGIPMWEVEAVSNEEQRDLKLKSDSKKEVLDWKRRTRRRGARLADPTVAGLQKAVNKALKLLGLKARDDLSPEGIDNAFRRASTKAHPDRGGSKARQAAVNEAYELLKGAPSTLERAKRKWERERQPKPVPTPVAPQAPPDITPAEEVPKVPQPAVQEPAKAVTEPTTEESAAEAAQRRSEEARPETEAFGAGPGGGRTTTARIRDDEIPEAIQAPEDQEVRLRKARGLRKPSLMQRIRETVSHLKNVTRAQEHIPNTEEFGAANEFFRLLRNVPSMAQDEAIRTTAAIADPLGPKQLQLFERYTIMQNLAASIEAGQPLRFGFKSAEEVEAYRAQLQDVVDRVPAVREAIETRRKIVSETVDNLVDYGLLPEAAKENTDTYYHQQVHLYMMAQERAAGGGTRAGKVGRRFQRKRVLGEELAEEELDYNTSYLEAESSWLTDANMEIEKERLLRQLIDKYDIKPSLQEAAKGNQSWRDLIREGYEIFQPEPGNHFYRAFTIPDRIVEQLHKDVLETAELSKEDLREVVALGMPSRQFVVPSEIAAQLTETRKVDAPGFWSGVFQDLMRMWKVYTLLNPKRFLAYRLRNQTGDIDPVVASDPALLKEVPGATTELGRYHRGRLQLTEGLRAARDHGVIGSGFTAEEVPDIKDLPIFRRFASQFGEGQARRNPVKGYWDTVKKYSNWHEDMLRYAAFLGYRKQLRQGRVKHYGGSKKAVVDQIKRDMGVDAAAAHLARNLLGDYGNISVAGNYIRSRLMPFWSFQEINLKRVPRLLINAQEAGTQWRTAGAVSAAAGRAILTSRIAWMYGAVWAWNHLIQGGDEEEELASYDRAVPHVILGRNPDGSIRTFRRVGALGDFLEWFGINEAIAMLGKRRAGQVDTADILKEMAFATPEKALNSLRPDLKALMELPTGTSLFPEPFQPRSVRRGEAVSHIFGLQDEYRWMKGWALGDGSTARPHYWQRWAVGVVDPRHAALSQIYDLRTDFLKKKGKEQKGIFPISRYKEARDAAKFENYDAFVDWKRSYVVERGDDAQDDFKDWLNTLDPIANRLNDTDELEFEKEFLTNEQRQRLTVARNYAHELRDLLVSWWDADERSQDMRKAVLSSAFDKMGAPEPEQKTGEPESKFRGRRNTFIRNHERAARDVQSMTSSHDEAQELLVKSFWTVTNGKRGSELTSGGDWKVGYERAGIAIAKLYGEDFEEWRGTTPQTGFRARRAKKLAAWKKTRK